MNLKASSRRLLFFWGSWCPVCKQMEAMLNTYTGPIEIIRINVDRSPRYAIDYQILGTPTLCLMERNEEINRVVGAISSQQLGEFIDG